MIFFSHGILFDISNNKHFYISFYLCFTNNHKCRSLKQYSSALAGKAQSVGALSHGPKGRGFNSWSGHMPGLWV